MSGWHVDVEVLLLGLLDDGSLGHRWVRREVPAGARVDHHAREVAGCRAGVCHSTSWRQEGPRLVMTYATLPDPERDAPREPVPALEVAAGPYPWAPSPVELRPEHVVAHALRHLADLALRDPVVAAAARREPELWVAVVTAAGRTSTSAPDAGPLGAEPASTA